MPDLLNQTPRTAPRAAPARPPRPAPPPRTDLRRRSRVLTGLGAALAVAATGLLIVEAISLIAWIAEPRSAAPLGDALRTGAAFWLLGHGGRLGLPAGTAALIPLGLSVLFALLASRAGAAVARVRPAGPRRRVLLASAVAVSVPYALIAALVAGVSHGGGLHPSVVTALVGALVLSAVAACAGAARELPLATPKRSRLNAVAAGVGVAGAVLLAVSAVIAAVALVTHLSDAAALARPAKAGAVGGFGLLMLQASLSPNAVLWSASYLLGPGFAVGAGTIVSPTGVHLGDVPGLPMLAGLPSGAAPWPFYVLFLVPPAAGLLAGIVMVRRLPRTPKLPAAALLAALVAVVIGFLAAGLAALSGGPVTSGRLATIGPSAASTGTAATLEIGIPAVLGAVGLAWRRQRRRGRAVAPPATLRERLLQIGPAVVAGVTAAARVVRAGAGPAGRSLARPFRSLRRKPVELGEAVEPAPVATDELDSGSESDEPETDESDESDESDEAVEALQPDDPIDLIDLTQTMPLDLDLLHDVLGASSEPASEPPVDPKSTRKAERAAEKAAKKAAKSVAKQEAKAAIREAEEWAAEPAPSVDLEKSTDSPASGRAGRLHVPTRLQRKSKTIKLPD